MMYFYFFHQETKGLTQYIYMNEIMLLCSSAKAANGHARQPHSELHSEQALKVNMLLTTNTWYWLNCLLYSIYYS